MQARQGWGPPGATQQKLPQGQAPDPQDPYPATAQQGERKISKYILMRSAKVATHMTEFLLCFRSCVGY